MPTYEYVCDACGHEFELFQQMTAPVKKKCPECAKLSLRRLIGTGAGVLFKGGGFYETDYRSDSYRKAADAEKKGADSGKVAGKEGTKAASSGESTTKEAPVKKSEPGSAGGAKPAKRAKGKGGDA